MIQKKVQLGILKNYIIFKRERINIVLNSDEIQNNNPIGVFDSGIGGATVLKEIIKILPNENYIYYSDSKNNPYGDKSKKEIIEICDNIVQYLLKRNCKIIVVACNTATAIAIDSLREKYPFVKFIGIEPAYKMVYDYNPEGETLIMATKGTIESERFNMLYQKYNNNKTYLLPCVGLADIIEEGNEEKIKKYLKDNLGSYKNKVKNVVLGCTHYPIIKNEILDIIGNVNFFEGSSRLALYLKKMLESNNLLSNSEKGIVEFIDTSNYKEKEENFWNFLS